MPASDDATLSALLDDLDRGPAASRAAWLRLREMLRDEPERVTARLCGLVEAALTAGTPLPEQAAILPAVIACTKARPDLIPESVLLRLLSRAEEIDDLSLLCLAGRLAQLRPEAVLAEGIFEVLVATERALVEPEDESARETQRYAKGIALELWRSVATRDPATLVALLEIWSKKVGWQRASSHLFAELLLNALPRHPELLADAIAVLEAIRAEPGQSGGPLEPPDRFIEALKKLRETARRKKIAAELAAAVAAEIEELVPVDASPVPTEPPAAAPDPAVDRLIEGCLSPDPERAWQARERLAAKMTEASPALVAGVTDAIDELLEARPRSELLRDLVLFLSLATGHRPAMVRVASLRKWAASDALDDFTLATSLSMLARVCPEWILRHMLGRALGVALAVGAEPGATILAGLVRAEPELLLMLVRAWLEVMGWRDDLEIVLCATFEEIARARPEKIGEMVDLLRQQRGRDPEPGSIDLRSTVIPRCIDQLQRLAKERRP